MKIVDRDEARRAGLKRFYTGTPCVNGHLSERYCRNGQCVECRSKYQDPEASKLYQNAYRRSNKEWLSEYDRARYAMDPEKKKSHSRVYYHANKDERLQKAKAWREANSQQLSVRRRAYYLANKDVLCARAREKRAENSRVIVSRVRAWVLANPEKASAQRAKRRADKANAIPRWFNEMDEFVWREAMELVRLRRDATGVNWAADHMIPLACRTACGLHVAANCQVIPSSLNNRKHNKLILTEPDEWLQYICSKPEVFASKSK